jgi:hypothetical protein
VQKYLKEPGLYTAISNLAGINIHEFNSKSGLRNENEQAISVGFELIISAVLVNRSVKLNPKP